MEQEYQQNDLDKMDEKLKKRLYKVVKTVCKMMQDRGYPAAQKLLEKFQDMKYEGFEKRLQESDELSYRNISNELIQPLYFTNSKNEVAAVIFQKPRTMIDPDKQILNIINREFFNKLIVIVHGETDKLDKFFEKGKEKKQKQQILDKLQSQLHLIEYFNFDDLIYNVTQHVLVPTHVPLTKEEKEELLKKYSIKDQQLPKILLSDPVTKYFGLKRGEVFKIIRDSETAGKYITYRIVV